MFFVSIIHFLSQFVFSVTFVSTLVGIITFVIILLKDRKWKQVFTLIIFTPYIVKLILTMEESYQKKILAIFILGGFVLTVFLRIITIVLTPPV